MHGECLQDENSLQHLLLPKHLSVVSHEVLACLFLDPRHPQPGGLSVLMRTEPGILSWISTGGRHSLLKASPAWLPLASLAMAEGDCWTGLPIPLLCSWMKLKLCVPQNLELLSFARLFLLSRIHQAFSFRNDLLKVAFLTHVFFFHPVDFFHKLMAHRVCSPAFSFQKHHSMFRLHRTMFIFLHFIPVDLSQLWE